MLQTCEQENNIVIGCERNCEYAKVQVGANAEGAGEVNGKDLNAVGSLCIRTKAKRFSVYSLGRGPAKHRYSVMVDICTSDNYRKGGLGICIFHDGVLHR
jgi:hypothetical protein